MFSALLMCSYIYVLLNIFPESTYSHLCFHYSVQDSSCSVDFCLFLIHACIKSICKHECSCLLTSLTPLISPSLSKLSLSMNMELPDSIQIDTEFQGPANLPRAVIRGVCSFALIFTWVIRIKLKSSACMEIILLIELSLQSLHSISTTWQFLETPSSELYSNVPLLYEKRCSLASL